MKCKTCLNWFGHLMKLIAYLIITFFAVVLWQPITAICKFYRDGMFETSQGRKKLDELEKRKLHDLSASRADLIETSIEATFEPLVQGSVLTNLGLISFDVQRNILKGFFLKCYNTLSP